MKHHFPAVSGLRSQALSIQKILMTQEQLWASRQLIGISDSIPGSPGCMLKYHRTRYSTRNCSWWASWGRQRRSCDQTCGCPESEPQHQFSPPSVRGRPSECECVNVTTVSAQQTGRAPHEHESTVLTANWTCIENEGTWTQAFGSMLANHSGK